MACKYYLFTNSKVRIQRSHYNDHVTGSQQYIEKYFHAEKKIRENFMAKNMDLIGPDSNRISFNEAQFVFPYFLNRNRSLIFPPRCTIL